MTDDICPRKEFSHNALRVLYPDWTLCLYCAKAFPSSSSNHHEMAYIDLTDDHSIIEEPKPPPPSRHQSQPALKIPLRSGLKNALDVSKSHRALSAQATRKGLAANAVFSLSISLFSGGYKLERNGKILARRFQKGFPRTIDKVTPVLFDTPTEEFPSHIDLINAIVAIATEEEALRAQNWEVIAAANAGQPGSISRFPTTTYNTVSLLDLVKSVNLKVTPPYHFPLNLLYAFKMEDDDDDEFGSSGEGTSSINQQKTSKGKKAAPPSKRKASASPSIKRETVKKEKKAEAQVKSEQGGEETSIKVQTLPYFPCVEEDNGDQNVRDDSPSAVFMSDDDQEGEEENGDDSIGNGVNNREQEAPKKPIVRFTRAKKQ